MTARLKSKMQTFEHSTIVVDDCEVQGLYCGDCLPASLCGLFPEVCAGNDEFKHGAASSTFNAGSDAVNLLGSARGFRAVLSVSSRCPHA